VTERASADGRNAVVSGRQPADKQSMRPPRHRAAVDTLRFGRALRALRIRLELTQAQLAARVGVSASMISRVENGRIGRVAFATLHAIGAALGADVQPMVRWRGEALDRLLDEAHAAVVDAIVEMLRHTGWEVAIEVSFSVGGERGSIDVFAWHAPTGFLLVIEAKSVVPDNQATLFGLDRKARIAPILARRRGWTCTGVGRLLVVADGRTSRRRVERHAPTFESALPARTVAIRRWLKAPTNPAIAGLLFVRTHPKSSSVRRVRARRGRAIGAANDRA
jgi:transcriptional regulator with XRE-family HTH domain